MAVMRSRKPNALMVAPISLLLFGLIMARSQQTTFRVETDLVNLYVAVTDKRGAPVEGIKKEQFHVWEDDAQQDIRHFSTDDVPFSIGLVLDRSGSMSMVIDDVYQAALHTLEASKPEDEAFVVVFNDRLELVQDFTPDRKALHKSLSKVRAGGQTALYDAVQTAINHLRKAKYQKKALLVVTDGADNSSETSYRELLDFARASQVLIHVIGLFGDAMRFGSLLGDSPDVQKLTKLAEVTGGKAYFPKTMKECKQVCIDTANELRHQYSLGYYPSNRRKDGKWRRIRVEVSGLSGETAGDLVIRAREGYYAPAE